MPISRRTALKGFAVAGASMAVPKRLQASSDPGSTDQLVSVLYDSTRCVGCKNCVRGCWEANGCGTPEEAISDLSPDVLSILNRYECADGGHAYRKSQCMHCVEPACVSACMLGAMHKDADGAVVWNGDLCVGCRYCQIACPFNVPRFEWDTPAPELAKCQLCPERRAQGLPPACVDQLPKRGALLYGTRGEHAGRGPPAHGSRPGPLQPQGVRRARRGRHLGAVHGHGRRLLRELGLPELGEQSVPALPENDPAHAVQGLRGSRGAAAASSVRRCAATPDAPRRRRPAMHRTEVSAPVGGRSSPGRSCFLGALALVGVLAVALAVRGGPGGHHEPERRLSHGALDRLRRGDGHGTGLRRLRRGAPGLPAEPGQVPPAGAGRRGDQRARLHAGRISVLIDIGRAWNFYKIPLFFWKWNFNSILLEVALCIMLYTMVLWIEVLPPSWTGGGRANGRRCAGWPSRRRRGSRRPCRGSSPWACSCPPCTSRRWEAS